MKKTNDKNVKNDNNIINVNDSIALLPTYSLEVYEDDYFKELILEPLSFLTSGDVIVVSTNSPIKNKNQIGNSPVKKDSNNDDEDDSDDNEESNNDSGGNGSSGGTIPQYYCPFCKKKFQTEQTWNTHINSTKHLNSIKDQKKKSTTTSVATSSKNNNNNTPTKNNNNSINTTPTKQQQQQSSSPLPSKNNNNNKSNTNQKDNEFIQDQIIQTQQAIKIKTSKPNLACKNLFVIARSYSQRQYIRDSAKTLYLIIEILTNQQPQPPQDKESSSTTATTTTNYSLNNILNTTTLLCKTHLYFGRLTRLFKQSLSEYNFIQSFNHLYLISTEQLQKYEIFLSNNKSPTSLYKVFLKQLEDLDGQIESKEKDKNVELIIIQINNYLNEISGGLCYCKVNYKSIIIYILASCITFKFKMYKESLESNSRAFKLLSSLKQYHWSIDLLLNNLIIKLNLINTNNQQQQQEKEEKEENLIYFQNLILLILKYCILIDDKIRLKDILNDLNFKKVISTFFTNTNNNNEIINCLIESSNQFLNENFKEIENLKDKYEHLIYSNKDIIFIFNQFDLKKKILLLK